MIIMILIGRRMIEFLKTNEEISEEGVDDEEEEDE
jgi:hypothetical protein